jgi:hypothetical protein
MKILKWARAGRERAFRNFAGPETRCGAQEGCLALIQARYESIQFVITLAMIAGIGAVLWGTDVVMSLGLVDDWYSKDKVRSKERGTGTQEKI